VKVFRRPRRGEARREWTALHLLDEVLPGVAPAPLRFEETDADAPVVEMTLLPGEPLAGAANAAAVAALVEVYAALDRIDAARFRDLPDVIGAPPQALDRIRRRRGLATPEDLEREPPVVAEAWTAAGAWLAHPDAEDVGTIRRPCFGRGDANLANHLWDGETLRIVDLEDSGRTDTAFQLAELAEHLSNHELPGHLEDDLTAALDLDALTVHRWRQARRALAIFWLGQLVTSPKAREINGPGRAEEQAQRVLALLG
jgi:hypothetical protein